MAPRPKGRNISLALLYFLWNTAHVPSPHMASWGGGLSETGGVTMYRGHVVFLIVVVLFISNFMLFTILCSEIHAFPPGIWAFFFSSGCRPAEARKTPNTEFFLRFVSNYVFYPFIALFILPGGNMRLGGQLVCWFTSQYLRLASRKCSIFCCIFLQKIICCLFAANEQKRKGEWFWGGDGCSLHMFVSNRFPLFPVSNT